MKLAGWVMGAVGLVCFLGQLGCGGGHGGTQSQGCTGAACGGSAACTSARTAPWPAGRDPAYHSPIAEENAKPGARLSYGKSADASGVIQLEAYASRASARAGDQVDVMVRSTTQAQVSWALYRIGWYGGAGARRVASGGPAPVGPQPACPMEAGTGLVRCAWTPTFSYTFGSDLVSGYYVFQVQRTDAGGTWSTHAPVILLDDRPGDLLVQAGTNTWQAYNRYGGESLYYDGSHTLAAQGYLAVKVSYDRPYLGTGLPSRLIRYELPFARWAERMGYDVTYATTFDVALGGCPAVARAGMYLQVGHDEYTPGPLRYALDQARDAGVPLAFFSGNPLYWKVRMEDYADARSPRTIVVYKAHPENDPNQADPTGRWRDAVVNHPENALVGVMYESWQVAYYPLVVADASSWLFRGTGLQNGDAFPGLLGHEYDYRNPLFASAEPAGVQQHAKSPVVDALGVPGYGESVSYRAPSGALVFGAGTIQWAYGLGMDTPPDDMMAYGPDPRVERMTANVIQEAIGVPMPAGPFAPLPPPPQTDLAPVSSVRAVARGLQSPAGVAVATVPGIAALPPGTLLVASPRQNQILKVDPATGASAVLAGKGDPGQVDGDLGSALFRAPTAVLQLPDGSLVVADGQSYALRRIDVAAGKVTHLAGGGLTASGAPDRQHGYQDGPGTRALFDVVMGLAWDPAASRIYVADSGNQRIRAVSTDGTVSTLAGNGNAVDVDGPAAQASFYYPTGVAVAGGRVFVLSALRVRAIAGGSVTTLAGNGIQGYRDGPGADAMIAAYGQLAAANGRLYFTAGPNYRLRQVLLGVDEGKVQTVAGQTRMGDLDGTGATALLGMPVSVAAAPDGTLYLTDGANGAVRALTP
ncbi:MAG TPA: N,N-dimethylformamidase beta subunit family domain-containing protein [Anaeromyxobacteraceae bacterium]|jgi:hypothetical protein|nr:N,N-dimethylformamidase beta subunit family domain-containing protein [Anaeromyxobacteraceae bacterium]